MFTFVVGVTSPTNSHVLSKSPKMKLTLIFWHPLQINTIVINMPLGLFQRSKKGAQDHMHSTCKLDLVSI